MKKLAFLFVFLLPRVFFGQEFHGYVVNAEGLKSPISEATLFFVDFGVYIQTDSVGYWQIDNIPEGSHMVEYSAEGYDTRLELLKFTANIPIQLTLEKGHRQLDKVIVSNNGVLQMESITPIEALNINELNGIQTSSLGQTLTNIPGVTQTSIGGGISKPVIRGLSGSSIVTYVNGLRIQNQQWGNDHGLPITSLGIGHAEVIKGPSSLLYGADALGGVLYFVDEPYAPKNTYAAFAQTKFEHNNLGTVNQAGFKWSKKALRFNAFMGYDNNADYQLPNGHFLQNSRYKQTSGKLAVGYSKKKWLVNLRYNFYSGRIGLPGHTHEANPDADSFQTTNQNRKNNVPAQRVQNHFTSIENIFFLGKSQLNITIGNTNNNLKEHEEKLTNPDIIINLNNTVYNAKLKYRLNKRVEFIAGSQGMLQRNRNGVGSVEELIPDANTLDLGAYGLLSLKHEKWRFKVGGRFDNRTINTLNDVSNFSGDYQGGNYSVGLARLTKRTSFRLNVSSGFRAPNTSELLSDGVHHGAFRYEIGNAHLSTEKAVQFDAGFGLSLADFEISVNPFYNRLNDYIFLELTDSIVDEFEVFQYNQVSLAHRYGGEVALHYHPHFAHWIHVESNFAVVMAEDGMGMSIPLTPQPELNNQLRFELGMKGKVQISAITLQYLYYFEQDRIAKLEIASPAYNILNAGITFKVDAKNPIIGTIGMRNILNENYINHLSGLKRLNIPDAGYAFYFSLRYEINQKIKNKK